MPSPDFEILVLVARLLGDERPVETPSDMEHDHPLVASVLEDIRRRLSTADPGDGQRLNASFRGESDDCALRADET